MGTLQDQEDNRTRTHVHSSQVAFPGISAICLPFLQSFNVPLSIEPLVKQIYNIEILAYGSIIFVEGFVIVASLNF